MRRFLPPLLLLAACTDTPRLGDPADHVCHREVQKAFPFWQPPSVDLLFLVDRTASMADDTARIEAGIRAIATEIERFSGSPPDLHIGFVSGDLGAGGVPGCVGEGDGARMIGGERCGLDGSFVRWRRLADGSAGHNLTADLADTLACLVTPPTSTCPVNQPLAAGVRAIDGTIADNVGFRRDNARLIVIPISDGDDCSLGDFNALAGLEDEAAVDFACFTRGVMCAPDEPATPGVHAGCVPRPGAGLLDPRSLSLRLHGEDFWHRMIGVFGGATPEVVAGPALAASCTATDGGTAGPALRLTAATAIAERDFRQDVCASTWSDELAEAVLYQPVPIPGQCFESEVDLDPDPEVVQTDCIVALNRERDDGTLEHVRTLPRCEGLPPGEPCFDIFHDDFQCPGTEVGWDMHWGDFRSPEFLVITVACRAACESLD